MAKRIYTDSGVFVIPGVYGPTRLEKATFAFFDTIMKLKLVRIQNNPWVAYPLNQFIARQNGNLRSNTY